MASSKLVKGGIIHRLTRQGQPLKGEGNQPLYSRR